MSLRQRLRVFFFGNPRFCDGCGSALEVKQVDEWDPGTGQKVERWLTSCPRVRVTLEPRGGASWRPSSGHWWARGRPVWHEIEAP